MSWWDEDISQEEKEELLRDISWKISETEHYDQMDAQVTSVDINTNKYLKPFIVH